MKKVNRYVLVNNIDELKEEALYEYENNIRVACMGVFHDLDKVTFPQTFKYLEPYDSHCCGDYFPCDKTEMIQAVNMQICKYERGIEDCKKILDTLKIL
jgi:hypothetical protein